MEGVRGSIPLAPTIFFEPWPASIQRGGRVLSEARRPQVASSPFATSSSRRAECRSTTIGCAPLALLRDEQRPSSTPRPYWSGARAADRAPVPTLPRRRRGSALQREAGRRRRFANSHRMQAVPDPPQAEVIVGQLALRLAGGKRNESRRHVVAAVAALGRCRLEQALARDARFLPQIRRRRNRRASARLVLRRPARRSASRPAVGRQFEHGTEIGRAQVGSASAATLAPPSGDNLFAPSVAI